MTPPPAPAPKPTFWRIRNIKTGERDTATKWLQEQVEDIQITEGQGFSLAADGERTLCATLTNPAGNERPKPPILSWRVDKDFIGFTPLSDPDDADVDIIAVTGLGGHALGSFRSPDGTSVWLRDFAPEDVPQARIITYGYDTGVVASDSIQGVHELARTLLDGLATFRQRTQTQQRPILFVCHSLGGVVLKEALVLSSKAVEAKHRKLLEITTVTYGLVFMGVPNLGLKHNQLQTIVKDQPNEGFIRDLLVRSDGEASQFLSYLTNEFSDLDRRRSLPFEIVSYYETKSSPTVVDSGGGCFVTDGPTELMVTKLSAERVGHLARSIDHLPSDTDHRGLVRFEHSLDARYMSMIEKLKDMAAEAPRALQLWSRPCYSGGAIQASPSSQRSKYLPFLRNHKFVGRTDEMSALEEMLFAKQECQKIALYGLGGVGKTQVALQFAYTVFEKHPDVSIFWVHAQSSETFEQTCRDIANVLGISYLEHRKRGVKELVKRHLSAEKAGKWMLIVDNADDFEVLEGFDGNDGILDYLPESESGLTIFTTRDKGTAQELARNSIMELRKLDHATAFSLFKKMLSRKNLSYNKAVVDKLLVELDYLPLAITQAAAYININPISIRDYLGHLKGVDPDLLYIMSKEMHARTRYRHAVNAVARTWLVSFNQILRRDADAADLLRYMSCIGWTAIPQSILPMIEPEARMTTAIDTLWSYSFITTREDDETYDMHRLVHLAARVWLFQKKKKKILETTQKRVLDHLVSIFPTSEHKNQDIWRRYIPHAARLRIIKSGENANARASLCLRVGRCLREDGLFRDAVGWLEESQNLRKGLSEEHPDRLASQHSLAVTYCASGRFQEAIPLLEHVVAIKARTLAEEHPRRLVSQQYLARVYRENGQVQEALQLSERVVAIRDRVLAEEHPDRLYSQYELAKAYCANGQFEKEVRLLEHIVAIDAQTLAEDHLTRLNSEYCLAMAYQESKQFEKAVRLLEHVVAIRKRVLAEDHPKLLASQRDLAVAYQQVNEAVRLLEH